MIISWTGVYAWEYNQKINQKIHSAELKIKNNEQETKDFAEAIKQMREAEDAARKKAAQEAAERATRNITSTPSKVAATRCNNATSHNNPDSIDIIVNKQHCLVPLNYAPKDMRVIYGATLRAEAAAEYKRLIDAATSQGISMQSTSSYRSYAQQVTTYNHWVTVNGSVAAADTVSARPGYSEHQTGLAVDVGVGGCALDCFGTTPAYAWMKANSHNFGFIERYPSGKTAVTGYSPEPWHYRYVGKSVATDMKTKRVPTLEEYWGVSGGSY